MRNLNQNSILKTKNSNNVSQTRSGSQCIKGTEPMGPPTEFFKEHYIASMDGRGGKEFIKLA